MSIEFPCPACRTLIRTPAGTTGKQARCPSCGGIVVIPVAAAAARGATTADRTTDSLNPYATSANAAPIDRFELLTPAELAAQARPRLTPPAIGMLVFAATGLLLMALVASLATANPELLFRGPPNAEGRDGAVLFMVGYFGFGFVTRAMQVLGALAMLRQSSYRLALAGAICALIPCEVYCCLPNLPLGIWALIVLNSPAVKAAFERSPALNHHSN